MMDHQTNTRRPEPSTTNHEHTTRSAALLRYGLAILITGFIFREMVYMTSTPYPGWLFLVLCASIMLLLLPYEQFIRPD
ncbi:MAG: hypothetical protein AAF787_08960 [Chloroflexota bacterium]